MKLLLLFFLLLNTLQAAPAFDRMREFKQADGTTFIAKGQGNQHLNWIETKGGDILRYNRESKNYEYAVIQDNSLKASGEKYQSSSNALKAKSFSNQVKLSKDSLYELWNQKRAEARAKRAIKP
jgi:hypothetical protein